MKALFLIISSIALFLAGIIHISIVPEHFLHTPIHGITFGLIGLAQSGWAVVRWRLHQRTAWGFGVSVWLSGGVCLLWLLTHIITPFSTEAHPIDAAAILTKLAEGISFVFLWGWFGTQSTSKNTTRRLSWAIPTGLSLASVIVLWLAGVMLTPLLPWLTTTSGHDHTAHSHDTPGTMTTTRTTAAYFSIVNSGTQTDTLVALSSPDIPSITLHQTSIDAESVARMQGLEGILLKPHVRVDFAPAGNHAMLSDLPRDLVEDDLVILTLHFASGRTVPVEFMVQAQPPEDRINFYSEEAFQVTNAWIRATLSLDQLALAGASAYEWQLPPGFPLPRVPENNPMTTEKVILGRYLFYDEQLSGNGTQSCSSCHLQELAFTDGLALPVGSTGDVHPRNSLTLTNVAYNATLTWANPNLLVLERQIPIPMFGEHPVELGITGNEAVVLGRFQQSALYQKLFAAAFPEQTDSINFSNITQALASFTRTLISGDSAYDRYGRGDKTALSESAQRGMALFLSEGLECHHCHTGFNFTLSTLTATTTFEGSPFFNTGLYNIDGRGGYPANNTGLHEITNNPADMGRFRPPTLRNIALTAPYMHDGSITTLPEVIAFYADGGRIITDGDYAGDGTVNPYKSGLVPGFTLSDQEIADLIAFLESLTDTTFITDERFSNPFAAAAPTD